MRKWSFLLAAGLFLSGCHPRALVHDSVSPQNEGRNWDLVVDSLMNDKVPMPDGVLPTSLFLEKGNCPYWNLKQPDSTGVSRIYEDECEINLSETEKQLRFRVFDVRSDKPKRWLFIGVMTADKSVSPPTFRCEIWVNEGFWNGNEPNDRTERFPESRCGESTAMLARLIPQLMQ